jgi:hypothetical protein
MSEENLDSEGIAGLRKQYEETKKALAEAQKSLNELQTEKRTQSVAELFKAKGLPETAAKHFTGEVSEDAVVAFATDLGLIKAGSGDQGNQTDANAEAARRLSQNAGGSQSLGVTQGEGGRVLGDPDAIMRLIQNTPNTKEGYQTLVDAGIMPTDPNRI